VNHQGIVREFHIVWRVVTLQSTASVTGRAWMKLQLARTDSGMLRSLVWYAHRFVM